MTRFHHALVMSVCIIVLNACDNDKLIEAKLHDCGAWLKEQPELALQTLQSIDEDCLLSSRLKAKYALLYSIALDKNYIDVQSDTIIAPAVKYYASHGTSQERFLCHYYEARIYENVGNSDRILMSIAKAEAVDTSKVAASDKCSLYAMKGRVYHRAWRIADAINAYTLASKYALQANMYRHYAYYTLELADAYKYNHDNENMYRLIQEAEKYMSYFTSVETNNYRRLMLIHMMDSSDDPKECVKYAESYVNEYPYRELINWHIVAKAYLYAGDISKAYEMLQKYAQYHNIDSDATYNGVLADVLEQLKDYQGALEAHRVFAKLVKDADVARHISDVKLVEERFENELIHSRQKHRMTYVIGLSIILAVIIFYMNIKWRRERIRNKKDLTELQQEYVALTLLKERLEGTYQYLSAQMPESFHTDQEVMAVLGQRIKSLSAFLQRPIPDSLSKVASQIDDLKKNKNYIVDSVGLLYAVRYPDFVSDLRKHGLTSAEIGYCCLYLLGLNIPEAGEVIGKVSSIYNVNSSIRKKLGITGMNLDKWLLKHFTEYTC